MVYTEEPKGEIKMEKAQAAPNYVTYEQMRNEMRYYEEDMRKMKSKIKLLVRILVDKKLIGAELAKTFEETSSPNEVLEWYLDKKKVVKK